MKSSKKKPSRRRRSRSHQSLSGSPTTLAPPMYGSVDAVVTVQVDTTRITECLAALKAQLPADATIILADALLDDAGEGHQTLAAAARDAGVRVDRSGRGRWDARNRGAMHGSAPLILFVDGDLVLEDGAWAALVAPMEREEIGAAGGLITFGIPVGADIEAGIIRIAGYVFGWRLRPYARFFGWHPDNPKVYRRDDLQALPANFLLTRRTIFRTAGGFAADVYGNRPYPDVEYCLQLRGNGLLCAFEPTAVASGGAEPIALSTRDVQEGAIILEQRAGHLIGYDEPVLL
jgi:GT2 family glycosyltransferase